MAFRRKGLFILLLAGLALGILAGGFDLMPGSVMPEMRLPGRPATEIARLDMAHDQDGDNLPDLRDITTGARTYIESRPRYQDGYYAGGYPPEGEGVCSDVIWQALLAAGYDLKAMVDEDIARHPAAYPRVNGRPEPNIDFRRVRNLAVFFQRQAEELTTRVEPGNPENLAEWQGGDIVVYGPPLEHIAIVSDRRRPDGVPLLLHNAGSWADESDALLSWPAPMIGHYRYPGGQQLVEAGKRS